MPETTSAIAKIDELLAQVGREIDQQMAQEPMPDLGILRALGSEAQGYLALRKLLVEQSVVASPH